MVSRKTTILLIVFLGLLAYVYLVEIPGGKRTKAKQEQGEQVLNLNKAEVTGLSFLPAGITIKKEDSRWRILTPITTDADHSAIESILDIFSGLKRDRFVSDNPNDFGKFGLSPYQAALIIKQKGSIDSLFLGDTNLDKTKVFYRKSGSNQVYLTAISLQINVMKSLYDLRDKSVLTFERDRINKISLDNKGEIFSFSKNKDKQWWLDQPIKAVCDEDKVDDILNKLKNSIVKAFISEQSNDLKNYDLANPWLTISLFDTSQKSQQTLFVGKKEDKNYYARTETRPPIFQIDSSLVAELDVTLFDLRDKTIVSFEQDSVTEIFITRHDSTFHCVKDSSKKWWAMEPDSGLAKSWKLSSLFYNIKDLKVARFVEEPYRPDQFYGLADPEIKLSLKQNNQILVALLFGKQIDNRVYLKNSLTNKIYEVKINSKDKLIIKPDEFLENKE